MPGPLVCFKYDLFDNLKVLMLVKLAITGVTMISSKVLIGDRFFTAPFSVKMLPPSKYVLSPNDPLQLIYK